MNSGNVERALSLVCHHEKGIRKGCSFIEFLEYFLSCHGVDLLEEDSLKN
jgi:hypothetical protein